MSNDDTKLTRIIHDCLFEKLSEIFKYLLPKPN